VLSAFVDSALLPFLDAPARITLNGLAGDERDILVDEQDDGTFETCESDRCTLVSFDAGVLEFGVTGFTTYSSGEPSSGSVGGCTLGGGDSKDTTLLLVLALLSLLHFYRRRPGVSRN